MQGNIKIRYLNTMVIADIPKTCFVCDRGKYEFVRMPVGVRNAPVLFQELS